MKRKRIAQLLAKGYSDKEIAGALGMSTSAIKWYVRGFRRKIGLYGNADERRLVVAAVQGKLV
jgi:DNA-binding NarL/FixJ family response regulator